MTQEQSITYADYEDQFSKLWFKLISVDRLTDKQMKWPVERDFIESDSLMFIVSETSEGRLVVNGHYFQLRPGAVFIGRPGQLIEAGLHAEEQGLIIMRFRAIEMAQTSHEQSTKLLHINPFPGEGEATLLNASVVLPLCRLIWMNWRNGSLADRFSSEAGFYEFMGLVLKNEEHKTAMALEYAKWVLERDFAEEITIEQLTATAGLSRFHFMRLFKEKFGKGVIEYVTELRLNEAKQLMRDQPDLSLREIAFRVGYKNETYFSNLFKKHMGVAPAVYLKNRTLKIAAYSWVNFGQLLALQIIPYAAPMDHYWTDYYRSKYSFDVTVPLSHHYEFNREALQQSKPDLILGIDDWIKVDEQERLELITPVLFLSWDQTWRKHLLQIADLVNRTKDAAKWLKQYDEKAASLRESLKLTIQDDKVLLVVVYYERLILWGRRAGTVLYDDLQLAYGHQLDQIEWTKDIEACELADYAADRLIVNVPRDAISQSTWQRISKLAAWSGLQAVKNNQVYLTSGFTGLESPWNEHTAFNHERFLQQIAAVCQTPKKSMSEK
ncbi:helix-turn-helix domain-containing protein [Paenibacillus sp. HWE-109]|uniref:AraC family transcriptional regulator n=1 Tax=Paenibacillus sp. HWE-109 TaxID=1306526 RepID=UPI001EDDFADA|nr:helix-turn-helix domain-containing protein [Paenibacillus sp. HWE-109]UKS28891.1 helix-turn-helix domain-containing protein [Paenibacillus sp. HWE-109]